MRSDAKGTSTEIMTERIKLLPRRLRVVHLLALIGRQFPGSMRRRELASLLRDEMSAQAGEGGSLR